MNAPRTFTQKLFQVSGLTLLSRLLGLTREILIGRYLGPGIFMDAFVTAFKIPNSLRKIFAEGALSAAMVPTFVEVLKKEGKQEVNKLMSLSFLVVQGVLLGLCIIIFFKADFVMRIVAPGWYGCTASVVNAPYGGLGKLIAKIGVLLGSCDPAPQVTYAIRYLRILIGFIVLLSASALFAAALQAVHHFFVPALAPALLNCVFIVGIVVCMYSRLPVEYLCYFILAGGLLQFFLHVITYVRHGFSLSRFDAATVRRFAGVVKKFLPCLLSMSIMEIHLFIDTSIASYLPEGSTSLIYLADRFMGIPLGVLAIAFSVILFPQFARVRTYAPKRLEQLLHEAAKVMWWVMIPITLFMYLLADDIFVTFFLSEKFSLVKALQAATILRAFIIGLFFASINKVLLNLFYSMHDTYSPLCITLLAAISNFVLSFYLFLPRFGAPGIAFATTISYILQTICFLLFLYCIHGYKLYMSAFFEFVMRSVCQLAVIGLPFYGLLRAIKHFFYWGPDWLQHIFLQQVGLWLWVLPLYVMLFVTLYKTRRFFGIRLYFLQTG